jgi:hypothetical protein
MALGADEGKVLCLFVGQELKLVLMGITIGAAGALILTRNSREFFASAVQSWLGGPADLCFRLICIDWISRFSWLHTCASRGQGRSYRGAPVQVTPRRPEEGRNPFP